MYVLLLLVRLFVRYIGKSIVGVIRLARLVFYSNELSTYSKAYALKLDEFQSRKIFVKLVRHFKLVRDGRDLELRFFRGGGGLFSTAGFWVKINSSANLGILCHEVAHAVDSMKRLSRHDKRFFRLIGRIVKYCENNQSIRSIVYRP